MTDWKNIKPGEIYQVGEPEFIGAIPVRTELEILPATSRVDEWAGQDVMPLFAGDGSVMPLCYPSNIKTGSTVMFRGRYGGWYMPNVKRRWNPFATHKYYVSIRLDDGRDVDLPVRLVMDMERWIGTGDRWIVDIRGAKQ